LAELEELLMQEFVKSIILGVVQGITEWLPISSTAHLLLLDEFLNVNLGGRAKELFFIIIQLASVLAVVVLFFSTLNPFAPSKGREGKRRTWELLGKIVVATIPAGVIGLLLDDYVTTHLQRWTVIALALFSYGLLYVYLEKGSLGKAKRRIVSLDALGWNDALFLGLFQTLALIPGTSRSGSTILGGIILGLDRPIAAQFSFFMAIPVMAGASALKLYKLGFSYTKAELSIMAVGFVTAFVVSLLVVKAMIAYIKRKDFSVFGYYRIFLAVAMTAYFLIWA
jgi:undecaprenyl-diphosphatase